MLTVSDSILQEDGKRAVLRHAALSPHKWLKTGIFG
jgi:hypothetical protein